LSWQRLINGLPRVVADRDAVRGKEYPWRDANEPAISGEILQKAEGGGAKSGAPTPIKPTIDPDLAALIDAWPTLPEAIRAGIVALVRAAGG
jgi:hypothetical protein